MSAETESAAANAGRGLFALAVAAMFLVEGLLYASTMVMPIAAPTVAADLGLDTALLGLYMALLNGTAMVASLFGGGLAGRCFPVGILADQLVVHPVNTIDGTHQFGCLAESI